MSCRSEGKYIIKFKVNIWPTIVWYIDFDAQIIESSSSHGCEIQSIKTIKYENKNK